jgi:4-amino-4-deoxy-L-arabinose transferase-like glycosyltransferase
MVFGESEVVLRLFSAILGIGSIVLMFKLGETLYDRETGLLAALFVAASPFLTWYSQEARMYSMLLFTVLAAGLCLAKALKDGDWRWWAGYALAMAIALFTNNGAIWFFVATNLYLLLSRRRVRQFWVALAAQVGVVLLYLPWLPSFIGQTQRVTQNFWLKPPTFDTVLDTFTAFQSFNFPWEFVSIIWITVVLLWIHLLPKRHDTHRDLLSAWLFVPILVSLLLSLRQPIFLLRNLTTAAIGYYLLMARAVWSFRSPRIAVLVVMPLMVMNGISLYHNYAVEEKEQWREAAAYVRANAAEGQMLLFVPGYSEMPFRYYDSTEIPGRGYPYDESLVHERALGTEDIAAATAGHRQVCLILSHAVVVDPEGKAAGWFDANARLIDRRLFKEIEVRRYMLAEPPS